MSFTELTDGTTKTAHTPTGIKKVRKGAFVATRHITGAPLRRAIRLTLVLCFATPALGVEAESIREDELTSGPMGKTQLTTAEIADLFSDVIDRGEVQNQRGISAETHWHADGTFISHWWREARGGDNGIRRQVRGRWRVESNLRCVTFSTGNQSDWSCAEVWLLDDGRVLSLNPDGSMHGLHRLSPLK